MEAVGDAGAKAVEGISNAGKKFEEFVIGPLVRLVSDADLGSVFGTGGKVYGVDVTPKFTYQTLLLNGVLYVTPDAGQAADLIVGVENGQVIIDGPDFIREEVVGYKKYDCWNGCDKRKVYDDVTHPNLSKFPAAGIQQIQIVGTIFDDSLVLLPTVMIGARIEGREGNDYLVGGSGNDEVLGGKLDINTLLPFPNSGNDRIFGGSGHDFLDGHDGDDMLYGELGNDALFGKEGLDVLDETQLSNPALAGIDIEAEKRTI